MKLRMDGAPRLWLGPGSGGSLDAQGDAEAGGSGHFDQHVEAGFSVCRLAED
jgi:hypothetical protein